MSAPSPECPVCRLLMQPGFVPDVGERGRMHRPRWVEGRPEKDLLRGLKIKGRRQLDAVTFRCPKCGWLIWFAPEPSGSEE